MSVLRYCDVCDKVIDRNVVSERFGGVARIGPEQKRVQVEVACGVGLVWNSGDLCLECLSAAINDIYQQMLDAREERAS